MVAGLPFGEVSGSVPSAIDKILRDSLHAEEFSRPFMTLPQKASKRSLPILRRRTVSAPFESIRRNVVDLIESATYLGRVLPIRTDRKSGHRPPREIERPEVQTTHRGSSDTITLVIRWSHRFTARSPTSTNDPSAKLYCIWKWGSCESYDGVVMPMRIGFLHRMLRMSHDGQPAADTRKRPRCKRAACHWRSPLCLRINESVACCSRFRSWSRCWRMNALNRRTPDTRHNTPTAMTTISQAQYSTG